MLEHLGDVGGFWWWTRPASSRKGRSLAAVQRHGGADRKQIGVFLAYAGARGRTLLDRELYLPQVWAEDRRKEARPGDVSSRTKPRFAAALDGSSLCLGYLGLRQRPPPADEQKGMSHVLAIKSNEKLWVWPGKGPRHPLAALVDASHWQRPARWRQGSQGLPSLPVARRSITKPGELAYYLWPRRNHPGGTGEDSWRPLGHRGML